MLELAGEDLRCMPLLRRKALLRELLVRSKRIRYLARLSHTRPLRAPFDAIEIGGGIDPLNRRK